MKDNDLGNYLLNKLMFPKILVVDTPGVIISRTSRFFGKNVTEKRNLYHFDEIFLRLRVATVRKMGEEKASDFFYRMGKDLGVGYMILGKAKKIPSFLLQKVIGSIHKILSTTGMTSFDKLSFSSEGYCVLKVKDGSRNLGDGGSSFFAGVYSGILSFLSGRNFEAQEDMEGSSEIVIKPAVVDRYVPDMGKLKLPENYFRINLPKNIPSTSCPSFSDLLRFRKIEISSGSLFYRGKRIFSTEQGMFDLITRYYIDEGFEDFFRKKMVEISGNLADEIFNKRSASENNLKEMVNMLCAFGWGVPEYTLKKNGFSIVFLCAPISKSPPLYGALVINGFLNSITGEEYVLKSLCAPSSSSVVKIFYNKV